MYTKEVFKMIVKDKRCF